MQDAARKREKRKDPSFRAKHNECQRKCWHNRSAAQKQKNTQYHKDWLAAHPDYKTQQLARVRASYDPVKMREKRDTRRPKIRASLRAYYRKNKERFFAAARIRRALKKAAAVNLAGIQEFVRAVKAKPFSICYYCHERVPLKRIHFDHIIPLSKGGAHAVENLCVACSACNLSKGAKPMIEWARTYASQQLLNL
jgi:5-methylcytosine-specific restriction endonuclease McrA